MELNPESSDLKCIYSLATSISYYINNFLQIHIKCMKIQIDSIEQIIMSDMNLLGVPHFHELATNSY